jgi:hypothetical protein
MRPFGLQEALGPLAGTLPRAAMVVAFFTMAAMATSLVVRAIRRGRAFLLLASWAAGMTAFVAGCTAFQAFARGGPGPVTLAAMAAFVVAHDIPLAALLLLGTLATTGIELTRAPGGATAAARPRDRRQSRGEAIGVIGESLVALELRELGWPQLSNVVLGRQGRSVEIDHLVRAPDGIIIIETKTLSGIVWGQPGGNRWSQNSGGQVRTFLNPMLQNEAHMGAVRAVIGDPAVSLRGLVVSAGHARFAEPIAGCVVPLRQMVAVLRESVAIPLCGQAPINAAWAVLAGEAARSEPRRAAHAAYVRSRKRVLADWF